jgi:hypothetical protein
MKKVLFGLLALGTVSAFASNVCEVSCSKKQDGSVFLKVVAAIASSPSSANQREAYSRTCVVSRPDHSMYFENKIEGLEITAWGSQGQMSRSEQRYYEEHGRSKPTAKEKKIKEQNKLIQQKISECDLSL